MRRRICFDNISDKFFLIRLAISDTRSRSIGTSPGIPFDILHQPRRINTLSHHPPERQSAMSDRNLELRRANYKSKSQFNAADVSIWFGLSVGRAGEKGGVQVFHRGGLRRGLRKRGRGSEIRDQGSGIRDQRILERVPCAMCNLDLTSRRHGKCRAMGNRREKDGIGAEASLPKH